MNIPSNCNLRGLLIPLTWLPNRYATSVDNLQAHLAILQIEPCQLNQGDYLAAWQLELLDDLYEHLQQGESVTDFLTLLDRAFLYRCRSCGDLRLTNDALVGDRLQHDCPNATYRGLSNLSGELELIARGAYDRLIQWAHSLSLGYDDPWKGP